MELGQLSKLSQNIFNEMPVRKTKNQKADFRERAVKFLEKAGWQTQVETGGKFVKSSNIIAGNPDTAKIVFAAHYDTPARLPFPNFITPCNILATVVYQLFICAVFFAIGAVSFFGSMLITPNALAGLLLTWVLLFVLLFLLLAGPANPTNANDNTSGVLTILELAAAMPPALRAQTALVLFDNEELGMLGSLQFHKKHKPARIVPLVNFDCVGEGDTFLVVPSRQCRKDTRIMQILETAFSPEIEGKETVVSRSAFTLFPSDQLNFKQGIGLVALCKSPVIGLYLGRIHTKKDTILQQENVLHLTQSAQKFAALYLAEPQV